MIRIRGLSKQFRLYRSPRDRIWEWLGRGPRHRAFWALRAIDLDIPRGRTVGIIGPNGAGKSTLLKIVTGTLLPTSGHIEVQGRVAALLELGTGFHPEFTGRQNIWINGQLLGLSPGEIARRESEIIEFSELGPFIDQPIRTYSSGMVVRLGFSVAASVEPDVLIVDEALSVGDAHFSQKCIRRIRRFREQGTTILFVSHDPGAVVSLCDEAVLLDAGEIVARGRPESILEDYTALLARRGEQNVEMMVKFVTPGEVESETPHRVGTFQALVTGARWITPEGHSVQTLLSGEPATLEIEIVFFTTIRNPTVGFLIRDRLGQDVFGTNTFRMGYWLGDFSAGDRLRLQARLDLHLGPGEYSLTTAVHRDETHLEECYDWTDRHYLFRVAADRDNHFYGLARLYPRWDAARSSASSAELSEALGMIFNGLPGDYTPGDDLHPSPFLQGFHRPERDRNGRGFRWTMEEAVFVARSRCGRLALRMAAWAHGSDPSTEEIKVYLETPGHDLGERHLCGGEETWLEWTLPGSVSDGLGLFRLRVTPTVRESPSGAAVPVIAAPAVVSDSPSASRCLGIALLAVGQTPDNSRAANRSPGGCSSDASL